MIKKLIYFFAKIIKPGATRRRVYDCFTFFNELELLKLCLKEWDQHVDNFVLVEATKTHQNDPKPLYFQENKGRFKNFQEKIIHLIVDDLPGTADPWVNEKFQRNSIMRALADCRWYDIILVSDADEIPSPAAITYYKNRN